MACPDVMLFESTGVLKYYENPYKAVVIIDPGIYLYYRALIPPARRMNGQRHAPHISVVRKQVPSNLDVWRKYEGRLVKFQYENVIRFGSVYCWLNVYSPELEEIVAELGLPAHNRVTAPPDGRRCFHTTLGNFKVLA